MAAQRAAITAGTRIHTSALLMCVFRGRRRDLKKRKQQRERGGGGRNKRESDLVPQEDVRGRHSADYPL